MERFVQITNVVIEKVLEISGVNASAKFKLNANRF